ncbi:MAG: MarR family winged helix-turn-helix transcriptional regulator, partial [Christensenellales bacterium]
MAVNMEKLEDLNRLLVKTYGLVGKVEQSAMHNGPYHDLSMTEVHTLEAVGAEAPRFMSEIAADLEITVPTLTVSIRRLIQKGYVCRRRCTDDRRVVWVELTEKGIKAKRMHDFFHRNMLKAVMRQFAEEE